MGLFSAKAKIEGFVTRLNSAGGPAAWLTEVSAFSVGANSAPLGDRALRFKAVATVDGNDADRFELTLPPGHYQLMVSLTPQVLIDDKGAMEVRSNLEGVVHAWPLPKAVEIKKGEDRHLNLKVDCRPGQPPIEHPAAKTAL